MYHRHSAQTLNGDIPICTPLGLHSRVYVMSLKADPRGGGPFGSGRQLPPPPQLTLGRRPLGGGGLEGGSGRGEWGGV